MVDKSEVLDVDDPDEEKYPLFSKADRYEVELQPGDILFIPGEKLALWVGSRVTTTKSHHHKFVPMPHPEPLVVVPRSQNW